MPQPVFVPRQSLAYDRLLSPPAPGEPFRMDESYRLCHLPLVNPRHPDSIASVSGKDYLNGRHGRVHSLVVPIPADALSASPEWQRLDGELRASSFASKIAWEIAAGRADRLHATVCGALALGEDAPEPGEAAMTALRAAGPFRLRLEGLFTGNVNRGRLYLEAHPEQKDGRNAIHLVQEAMGRPATNLYVVGIHNLTDHLDAAEAVELAQLVRRWRGIAVAEVEVRELWLMSALDDLVLDARVERRVPLA